MKKLLLQSLSCWIDYLENGLILNNLDLQRRFKKIYSQWMGNQYANNHKWHADTIRANYSTIFLIKNIEW
jgi:hypothetical protein